ncbi:MAG: response regulator [Pseudomonadota bacterium]
MKTVLVVEDNRLNRELMEAILDFNGYSRLSVDDGLLAFKLARTEQPDLVLMDLQMPEVDGYQALEMLRGDDQTRHIPVVAVTGNATRGDIERMEASGFDDIITKPYHIDDVLNVIRRILP